MDRGLLKVEKLGFLAEESGRTLGQAALQYVLSHPSMVTVLPNLYDMPLLEELAADVPPLTTDELARLDDLHAHDYYLDEAHA